MDDKTFIHQARPCWGVTNYQGSWLPPKIAFLAIDDGFAAVAVELL
jgi:hypothetical protein